LESHDGSVPLHPQDLHIGATVTILSHKFDILDCDQYTFKYMEANCGQWNFSDLKEVEAKVTAKKEVIQRLILTLPGLTARNMDVKELQEILNRSGLHLIPQEVHTIFRAVDTYRVGTIKATKMLKYFMDLR
jgi:Ca2+-binding EF-hand superfamily protein